jgi:hypothetical protein
MPTDPQRKTDPFIMTARLGFRLLIPVLVCAFAGCDTPRHSVGAVAGPDSSQATQDIPQSQANASATTVESPALEATRIPDGIARIHGSYYTLRNGKATHLDQKQRFTEGLYFERSGRITLSDGNIVKLHDGEMVTFGGERRDVPLNIRLPRPLPADASAGNSPL